MLQNAFDRDPPLWLDLQNLVQQVLHIIRDAAAELHPRIHDVVVDVLDLLRTVRRVAMHQLIEQDAEAPDVHGVVIRLLLQKLWAHVLVCTTEGTHLLVLGSLGRPSEVAELYVVILVEEQIFWLRRLRIS